MPLLDLSRFDHLSESDIIQRISSLLALGVIRHQHAQRRPLAKPSQADLIRDPIEQEIVRHLTKMGQSTSIDLQQALGVSRNVLLSRLQRLRQSGLCLREGHTRGARYRLRQDFSWN